jgi:hypothetical protein
MKSIREVLGEYRTDITDFEVERSSDGASMVLKLGVKLYETKSAGQIVEQLSRLGGIKNVKWETE